MNTIRFRPNAYSKSKQRNLKRRLNLESLEDRRLMVASPALLATSPVGTGSDILGMTVSGNSAYFFATDDTHGRELWKSDGTEAGTILVKDIAPGSVGAVRADYDVPNLVDLNGTLLFTADDGVHGKELWKTDGTLDGTVLVADLHAGKASSEFVGAMVASNGLAFFDLQGELWKTDGTADGTQLVKDIDAAFNAGSFATFNGLLYFNGLDAAGSFGLWRTDGTAEGTRMIHPFDIFVGQNGAGQLTPVDDTLFFAAGEAQRGLNFGRRMVPRPAQHQSKTFGLAPPKAAAIVPIHRT